MVNGDDLESKPDLVIRSASALAEQSLSDEMTLYRGVDGLFHDICDISVKKTDVCLYL